MTDPIRAALERLLSDIQALSDSSQGIEGLHLNGDCAPWVELLEGGYSSSWLGDAIAEARTALAHPAPPAEGEVSDDEGNWQWYTYCPEEGIELYRNKEQAKSAAEGIMGFYQKSAHSDGWHEDMESVSWGKLVPFEQAQVIERRQAEPGGMWDEWVEYKLRATRQARPATEDSSVAGPADGEVAELVADLRSTASGLESQSYPQTAALITRAADLLQHHQPPQPVAVSERPWEREGWCDEQGRCWLRGKVEGDWRLLHPTNSGVPQLKYCFSHSLPHNALPLPTPPEAGS
jgi:hypothetical protein